KERVRGGYQFVARRDVVEQRRPRNEQRALLREDAEIDRRNRARGLTERDKHAARLQTVERTKERVLADRIINNIALVAARDLLHGFNEILLVVVDDVLEPVRPRQVRLFRRADGTNQRDAELRSPL